MTEMVRNDWAEDNPNERVGYDLTDAMPTAGRTSPPDGAVPGDILHAPGSDERVTSAADFVRAMREGGELGSVDADRLLALLPEASEPFDVLAVELGILRDAALVETAAQHLGLATVEAIEPDEALTETLGLDYCAENGVAPLGRLDDGRIALALADPFDAGTRTAVAFALDATIAPRIATRAAITTALAALRPPADDLDDGLAIEPDDDLERLRDVAREEPVVRLVARTVQQAVADGATDIHIEPHEREVRVRMRRDGMLRTTGTAPKAMHAGLVTRIKILARLNISERRLPQDGRMRFTVRGQEVDLRVSVMPTIHGETVVLRVLDRSAVALDLAALGYGSEDRAELEALARSPNGIVLVTGPTGSGKTTTLYSMLRLVAREDTKVFTVEDPVEVRLDGVTQLQVEPGIGLTFATALRSVLRQDPDIVLVGEIRDPETAEIAVQAALTGHLVLSTLHTNTALGAVTRLRDLGIDDYLIGATLKGVVAQRLVRLLCPACGGENDGGASETSMDRVADAARPDARCERCSGTGYHGRTAASETVAVDPSLGSAIADGCGEPDLLARARERGHRTMGERASSLVTDGRTSRKELARVLGVGALDATNEDERATKSERSAD